MKNRKQTGKQHRALHIRIRLSVLCGIAALLASFLLTAPVSADYYDWEGNYHADNGYVYTSYGYYDPFGNFYQYETSVFGGNVSEDGLNAVDPYGFYKYVPIFYKEDVNAELVDQPKADIQVGWVGQNPEMPNGCEATATTIALNYAGFSVDKVSLATKYFYQKERQIDFRNYYIGNPLDHTGLGCYSNAVVNAANGYLDEQDTKLRAFNYTNYPFESLLNQVAMGYPVIIWATVYMLEPYYGIRVNIDGKDIVWISQEHCLVLCGYDLDRKTVKVADPLVGITEYDMNMFKKRFTQLGNNAVIIKTARQQYEEVKDMILLPFNDKLMPQDKLVRGSLGFDGIVRGTKFSENDKKVPRPKMNR